jgi:hypothetical protein
MGIKKQKLCADFKHGKKLNRKKSLRIKTFEKRKKVKNFILMNFIW